MSTFPFPPVGLGTVLVIDGQIGADRIVVYVDPDPNTAHPWVAVAYGIEPHRYDHYDAFWMGPSDLAPVGAWKVDLALGRGPFRDGTVEGICATPTDANHWSTWVHLDVELRKRALNEAIIHTSSHASHDAVVAAARAFYAFLKGEAEPDDG